ncbi:MAG: DUF6515 family protein [Bacteroidota bacterium]
MKNSSIILFSAFMLLLALGSHDGIAQRKRVVRKTVVVNTVPRSAVQVRHHRVNYWVHNNVYYRRANGRYVVVSPPRGIRVTVLPPGYRRVVVGRSVYFYAGGNYYLKQQDGYITVPPPVGALVETLPDSYEQIEVEGDTYYITESVQYKAIIKDEEVWYEVVKVNSVS